MYNRNIGNLKSIKKKTAITDNLSDLKDADLYIISITDDAIHEFSQKLLLNGKLVVHTSGSIAMNALNGDFNKGVFYPLQTFTKGQKVNFKKVPICIETEVDNDLPKLEEIASSISKNVYIIDSKQREKLHLSAVFVNNFVNHLYHIADGICKENKIPFEILYPLIIETSKKIKKLNPKDAQTGPAIRNDRKTINHQLMQLTNSQKEIYSVLTDSILKTYNN